MDMYGSLWKVGSNSSDFFLFLLPKIDPPPLKQKHRLNKLHRKRAMDVLILFAFVIPSRIWAPSKQCHLPDGAMINGLISRNLAVFLSTNYGTLIYKIQIQILRGQTRRSLWTATPKQIV